MDQESSKIVLQGRVYITDLRQGPGKHLYVIPVTSQAVQRVVPHGNELQRTLLFRGGKGFRGQRDLPRISLAKTHG